MVNTVFDVYTFNATGGTTPRTMPTRLSEVINVKDYGAVGDGVTDDTTAIQSALDAAFGSSGSPHGPTNSKSNKPVFFPNGIYKVSGNPALTITGVCGGFIYGAGMFTSIIRNTDANSVVFKLNGFGFSTMQNLGLESTNTGAGTSVGLDYDWDNVAPQSSQNSSFINCYFSAQGTTGVCARCGNTGFQVDTSSFINCYMAGGQYGLTTNNLNALGITVLGGQIQGCTDAGIYVIGGSVATIHGVYFSNAKNDTGYDIHLQGGAADGYSIAGCRTESTNFLHVDAASATVVNLSGTDHAGKGVIGHFVRAGGDVNITSCWSQAGDVFSSGGGNDYGTFRLDNCIFNRFDGVNLGANNVTALIKNCTFGDVRTGIGRVIVRQNNVGGTLRTYEIESIDITADKRFFYDNYLGAVAQNNIINTLPTTGTTVAFTNATPTVVTFPQGHHFQGGEPVAFSMVSSGVLPGGVTANRTYFVTQDSLVNNMPGGTQATCHLSNNSSNALAGLADVNVASSATGNIHTWSVRTYAIGDQVLNAAVIASSSPGWVCTTAGRAASVNAGETQAVFKQLAINF